VITTHARFARKVQRKLSNGVAGFAAGRSSPDREKRSRPIRAFSLRIRGAAAQRRVVSMAGIQLDSRKSVRSFKAIICDDISEFESHMPSHAVGVSTSQHAYAIGRPTLG
jgi:hypothetical protein